MEKIQIEYTVTLSDYRRASYYGLFLRRRRPLQIMFVVLLASALYAIGASLGLGTVNPLVFFLAGAYLIWGLLLFAGTEREIRRYLRTPGNFIGCTYRATLESHRVQFEIPERDIRASRPASALTCAFELSQLFLIYISPQDLYILPCRALSQEQRAAFRENLRQRLGDKFATRFRKGG